MKKNGSITEKNQKTNNGIYILIGVGVLIAAVLLLLQTGFQELFRLDRDGYAITNASISQSLLLYPEDEHIEEHVQLTLFAALDYVFQQGNDLFIGEERKNKLQSSYPVYLDNGAAIQLLNASSKLLDVDFAKVDTYEGMILMEQAAYNRDGKRADAADYLFLRLSNGNFINLTPILYRVKGVDYDIDDNSIIHFEKDYFAYYEINNGNAIYKSNTRIQLTDTVEFNGITYTYEELLLLLEVLQPKVTTNHTPQSEIASELPTEPGDYVSTGEVSVPSSETPTIVPVKTSEETDTEPPQSDTKKPKVRPPKVKKEEEQREPKGVRPDSMRPDKETTGGESKEPVVNYEKPTVQVSSYDTGVYRIEMDLKVTDPAQRLHKNKMVQVEVYEVQGNTKTLVMRSFKNAPGGKVELGGGSIKPDTEYDVKTFFTYFNEYGEEKIEDVDAVTLKTDTFESLQPIVLKHNQGIMYHNKIQIDNIAFDETSDAETVYGIATSGGMAIQVREKVGIGETKVQMNRSIIGVFKKGGTISASTLSVLKAKTEYSYEFVVEDFFGNILPLINATGEAQTCKNPPTATLTLEKNEISDVQVKATIDDEDHSFATSKDGTSNLDIYYVVTKENVKIASEEDLALAAYYEKVPPEDYVYAENGGIHEFSLNSDLLFTMQDLELDTKYRAAIFVDYDLDNQAGAQRFQEIGNLSFVAAGLSTLGNVYIKGEISEITAHGISLSFALNDTKTNTQLKNLLTDFKVQIVNTAIEGDDDQAIAAEVGFSKDTPVPDGTPVYQYVYEMFRDGKNFGAVVDDQLQSMTEYVLKPSVKCTYLGKSYNVNTILDIVGFKTLREIPKVTVTDEIFAGGQILFDASVLDEDGTICGNSGNKVIVSLYQYTVVWEDGVEKEVPTFIKRIRIEKTKNRDNPIVTAVKFNNLDMESMYYVTFTAVEYNDGYTSERFVANKEMNRVYFNNGINYTGTIRMQDLSEIPGVTDTLKGDFLVRFTDPSDCISQISVADYDYYIETTKHNAETGEFISSKEQGFVKESGINDLNYSDSYTKGAFSYTLSLYVKIGNRKLMLDEITFTTESKMIGFSSTYEYISLLKNNPKGRYIATCDIVLESGKTYYPIDGDESSGTGYVGNNIVGILNGDIDFQGFTLSHHYQAKGQRMFTNIGPGGRVHNLVYDVYWDTESAVNDDACMSYRNYGEISDVYVNYKGGEPLANTYVALLTRVNAATGIVENFVICHKPDPGKSGFSVKRYGGLICYNNYGIVRNGYAYGTDIYCALHAENTITKASSYPRYIGGLVGYNISIGQVTNVYSLLGLQMETYIDAWTGCNGYGSVVGYSSGYTGSMYATEDNSKKANVGSTVGTVTGSKYEKVYFYSASKMKYTQKWMKEASLESLYDTGWQKDVLGDEFVASNVETGFYPHVNLSSNLPQQEYLPLPLRVSENLVDIAQMEVISYDNTEGQESAYVKFRFSNNYNTQIQSVSLDALNITLQVDDAESEDGYTVIYGTVSGPTEFKSSYSVTEIAYTYNQRTGYTRYQSGQEPQLLVDFYRNIYTADEWNEYVVKKSKKEAKYQENIRLRGDIDFAGIDPKLIRVEGTWYAKLDGCGHTISNIDLAPSFRSAKKGVSNNLFNHSTSLGMSGSVSNLTILNYTCGGVYQSYSAYQCGVFRYIRGDIRNIHLINATATGYDCLGGLTARSVDGALISDCTVNDLTITYIEPKKLETDCSIGGIVGNMADSRVNNCYVKNINVVATDMKSCNGIGGICGYAGNSVIQGAYATGAIESRGNKTGGIVGQYKSTNEALVCISDVIARVNIIGYTDMIGGLVGCANITSDMISETNNISGVAFGDVYAYNPDSLGVSHTVGSIVSKKIKFFGCETQLMNGVLSSQSEYNIDVCRGLISYEESMNPNTYTEKMEFSGVYNYTPVQDGNLPHLYYEGTGVELPYQGTDGYEEIPINPQKSLGVEVVNVETDPDQRVVRIKVRTTDDWKVSGITIEQLKYEENVEIEETNTPGVTMIYVKYLSEAEQEHFLDSYVLSSITVEKNGSEVTMPIACRIPITMYKEIATSEAWMNINTEYENYLVVANLDFTNLSGSVNKKIGRVVGRVFADGSYPIFSNISVTESESNFIARLNSQMSNLVFDNVTIQNGGKDCVGIIGTSYGTINHVNFNNIVIQPSSIPEGAKELFYVGIIGYQNGSSINNVKCSNIIINGMQKDKMNYTGSLVGYLADIGEVSAVEISDSSVHGYKYTGGLVGTSYCVDYTDIKLHDIKVTGTNQFTGGMAGRLGTDGNCLSAKANDIEVVGSITNAGDSTALGKTIFNVELESTPGEEIISGAHGTTVIEGTDYVGSIAGQSYITTGVYSNSTTGSNSGKAYTALVSGCMVKATGNYVGGAFGYNVYYAYWTDVNDSYVYAKAASGKKPVSVGGIIGRSERRVSYCSARNNLVESYNYSEIGGIAGSQLYHDIRYTTMEYSHIFADALTTQEKKGVYSKVGGIVGYIYGGGSVYYDGVIDSVINAENHSDVGGIVGRLNSGISNGNYCSYCFCVGTIDPNKKDKRDASKAMEQYCIKGYTNVGGIIGYQYSGRLCYCESNMNVIGNDANTTSDAGGLTGFYHNGYVVNTNRTKTYSIAYMYRNYFAGSVKAHRYAGGMIGTTGLGQINFLDDLQRIAGSTGTSAEKVYTYANLLLPYSVDSSNANAVLGESDAFTAKGTRVWAGSQINGTDAYDVLSGYATWNGNNTADRSGTTVEALKLVTSDDLANWRMYYNLNWIGGASNYNGIWRTMIMGYQSGRTYGYNIYTITENSLPVLRNSASTQRAADEAYYILKLQKRFMKNAATQWLPIPKSEATYSLRMLTFASSGDLPGAEVYASDVDVLNIEFDEALIKNESADVTGYFAIYCEDEEPVRIPISQRVYSYTYDFAKPLVLEYGEAYYDVNSQKYEYYPYEEREIQPIDVTNRILTDGNYYYYIQDGDLYAGTGNTQEHIGSNYIHLMQGCAMSDTGQVLNLKTRTPERIVGNFAMCDVKPLQEYDYMGYHIDTYYGFSTVHGSKIVNRPMQMFVVKDSLYTVDANIPNVKDAILLYRTEGNHYQTILGEDGMVVDMFQEEPIFPEELYNSGISDMTNTWNTTATYALIEYANGGLAGYNYVTGEVLFDYSIQRNYSLLDYARIYFTGEEEPMLRGIHGTYRANRDLSESIETSRDLDTMVGNQAESSSGQQTSENAIPTENGDSVANGTSLSQGEEPKRIGENSEEIGSTDTSQEGNDGEIEGGEGVIAGIGIGSINGAESNNTEVISVNGNSDADGEGQDQNPKENEESSEEQQKDNEQAQNKNDNGVTNNANDNSAEVIDTTDTTSQTDNNTDGVGETVMSQTGQDTVNEESLTETNTAGMLTESEDTALYMVVFNATTGVYEIVNENEFLSNASYQSENKRLGVTNLAEYSGYAVADSIEKDADGLSLYIVVALSTLGIAGVLIYAFYRKQKSKHQ